MFDSTTTLYDTLRTDFGCDSIITVLHIIVQPTVPLKVTADTTICDGSSVLLKAAGGNNFYSWSSTDNTWHPLGSGKDNDSKVNPSIPSVLVTPTGTTLYIVFSRACDGSIISENVTVTVQPKPVLTIANNDTCINLGQEVMLETNTDDRIDPVRWSHDGKEICANCANLTFQPFTPGKVLASIVDQYGCAASDSIYICVTNNCLENTLVIPNFITPNGDGKNDNFRFLNPEHLPIIFLRIYDRWGEMLFESSDQEPFWDGTFKGKSCSPGTYVYMIEAGCNVKGNITKSGNVSIIK
jgi:gliding motility-associated-like protein